MHFGQKCCQSDVMSCPPGRRHRRWACPELAILTLVTVVLPAFSTFRKHLFLCNLGRFLKPLNLSLFIWIMPIKLSIGIYHHDWQEVISRWTLAHILCSSSSSCWHMFRVYMCQTLSQRDLPRLSHHTLIIIVQQRYWHLTTVCGWTN